MRRKAYANKSLKNANYAIQDMNVRRNFYPPEYHVKELYAGDRSEYINPNVVFPNNVFDPEIAWGILPSGYSYLTDIACMYTVVRDIHGFDKVYCIVRNSDKNYVKIDEYNKSIKPYIRIKTVNQGGSGNDTTTKTKSWLKQYWWVILIVLIFLKKRQ